jgi:hypothetical protein
VSTNGKFCVPKITIQNKLGEGTVIPRSVVALARASSLVFEVPYTLLKTWLSIQNDRN